MKQTTIPPEDWAWLRDVHKVDTREAKVIILYGNEGSPDKIEVYAVNDHRAQPMRVYRPGAYPQYTVVVGNCGTVFTGHDLATAHDHFRHFRDLSKRQSGRVANEPVTMFRGDAIVREYQPRQVEEAA